VDDPVQNPYIDAGSFDAQGDSGASIKERVRIGMIITFALVQGLVIMTAIILFVSQGDAPIPADNAGAMPPAGGDWVLPGIGLVACIGACFASFFVVTMMKRVATGKFRSEAPPKTQPLNLASEKALPRPVAQLLGASQTWTIVGQAILEGAAVINVVLMLIDHNYIHLAAIGILIAGIVIQLPTVSKSLTLIENARSS
jgi:hypothetical protein